ncbi:fungal-specific transcription factor domain-containing protein [Aspergillus cavernicola]|uniref:Fungal-specific transcription factor domain-containing protein n=1 Tax=Aspergillus cavernicola TaxID=176166 RepID=A0ABR4I4P1_9EURO
MEHPAPGANVMPARRMQDNPSVIHGNARSSISHDSRSRRRKPLACEMCYRRKIKCEFEDSSEACIQCMRRNLSCKTVSSKGTKDNHKRSRYVKSLEERLRKTESLLRAAGVLVEPTDFDDVSDASEDCAGDDSPVEGQDDAHTTPKRESDGHIAEGPIGAAYGASVEQDLPASQGTKRSSDSNTSRKVNECRRSNTGRSEPPVYKPDRGNSLYIGRSTPLSILTREGIEWVKSRSGEANSLDTLLSSSKFDSPWAYWRPDVFHDVFSSRVFKPLPPRAEVFSLVQDYFRTVNFIIPLYHEETFMQLVEWQYTQQTCDDAARWASINIILALAYEYRFSNSPKSEKDREKAWLYYKNALSVFPELVLRRTDLLSVQALLGMALFLRGNSGSQSTVPIVTAAIRSSHRMGLHRETTRPSLSQLEQEQRRKVFWVAYTLDQSLSIRLGNAPAQHFDDFDVEFPTNESVQGLMMADHKAFFPQVCRIAVIRSRIYSHFYSARALENKSTGDICEMVHKLHAELQEWKSNSQFDTLFKQRGTGEDFLAGFASAGLFFLYYNSLIMIHRLPLLINFIYQSRVGRVPELDLCLMLNQSSSSAAVCVQAARDTLKLVNNLPWGDIAWIWSLLYYVFLAVMTIFANILRNSQQPTAKDDLQSLNMAATFFATLVPADGPCNYARFMTRMSMTFERIARTVLERDQKTVRPDTKSKPSKSRAATHTSHAPAHSHSVSPPNHAASTNIDIPNLEGLPPINSSGYVVRESPTPSPSASSTVPPSNPIQGTGPTGPGPGPEPPNLTNLNNFQAQQPYTTENINMAFPLPALDEATFTFPQPELWQIPLTADWEIGFGGQFLGGILGHPNAGNGAGAINSSHGQSQNYLFQGGNVSEPMGTAPPVSVPMMDGTGAVGYGYGSGNGSGNNIPGATLYNHSSTMWMGGYGNPL